MEGHIGWDDGVNVFQSVLEYFLFIFPVCEGRVCNKTKCFIEMSFVVVNVTVHDMVVA